jgi:predicted metal-dependent peptidase
MTTNRNLDFDQDDFMEDYARGLDMLRLASRAFAVVASGIGYPIANTSIPTAQVSVNLNSKKIEFEVNPHFIHKMKDSEIASVIAHETYHVLLGHLGEMADIDTFPKREILIDAQECIINDGLPGNVGFATPAGTFKGIERHNQDFSIFSTQEGYDFILQKQEEEEDSKDDDKDEDGEKSDSSQGSGSGSGSPSDEKDDSEGGSGSSEKDDSDKGDDEDDADGGAGDENEDDADGDHDAACGGPQVTGDDLEDMSPEDIADAIKKVLGKAVDEAVQELNDQKVDATPELEEMIDNLKDAGVAVNNTPNYGNPQAKDTFEVIDALSGVNLNWVELLKAINPDLKTSGRPKYRDAWHAPRRKMLHSYPQVVLPTRKRLDDPNEKKGDSLPTFIIALDMSGSIPTSLLKDLASLAQSIPTNKIKAFPITWSDNYRIFDVNQPNVICGRGGTRIGTVQDYADRVAKEEGVDPYVLVITDGGFYMPSNMDRAKVSSKWYWMAIQPGDVRMIANVTRDYATPERIFNMKDYL